MNWLCCIAAGWSTTERRRFAGRIATVIPRQIIRQHLCGSRKTIWATTSFSPRIMCNHLQYRQNVKGNQYGRQEEVYQCEDCTGCTYASQCKKTDKNRTIRLNQELTSMHQEVVDNLESIHGALLRMNRSIQSEGTFGIMKSNRWYKRIVRKGMKQVRLEIFLVSIGHNLYKYHNKKLRLKKAA